MTELIREWYETLQVDACLERYPGLRSVPSRDSDLVVGGTLAFRVVGPDREEIADEYEVELRVPHRFPTSLPTARETARRISESYHKLEGDLLCLAAATELRMRLTLSPTLLTLVEGFVIPYLYGHSYFIKHHGKMPYGELSHGDKGIRECLAAMFGARQPNSAEEFLRLAGMKKRVANRQPCPCGSGRRLGRCHNRNVNRLRRRMGRGWFRTEYTKVLNSLD